MILYSAKLVICECLMRSRSWNLEIMGWKPEAGGWKLAPHTKPENLIPFILQPSNAITHLLLSYSQTLSLTNSPPQIQKSKTEFVYLED